jgi:two-component sensor histidine kinase
MNGDEQFLFRWSEKGGPAVVEPMRKGFGTTILLDAAKQFGNRSGNISRCGDEMMRVTPRLLRWIPTSVRLLLDLPFV